MEGARATNNTHFRLWVAQCPSTMASLSLSSDDAPPAKRACTRVATPSHILFWAPQSEYRECSEYGTGELVLHEEETFLLDRVCDPGKYGDAWSPEWSPNAHHALAMYLVYARLGGDTDAWESGDPAIVVSEDFLGEVPECDPALLKVLKETYATFVTQNRKRFDYILIDGWFSMFGPGDIWARLGSYFKWLRDRVTLDRKHSPAEVEMVQRLTVDMFKAFCKSK